MNSHKKMWDTTPSLYDFISVREEAFGGYIYNPFFFNTLQLNVIEKNIVDLLDGRHNLGEIFHATAFNLPYDKVTNQNYFFDIINRLQKMYAINWQTIYSDTDTIDDKSKSETVTEKSLKNEKWSGHISAPLSVLWDITYACNLRCEHCLSSSGTSKKNELSLDEVKEVIDELAKLKVFTITFCGGEPLVRKDFYEILEYATHYKMGLKLTTNGMLITEKTIKDIDRFNIFGVKISLDGTKETHDKFRKQKGAYEKAINAIKLFADAGYYTVVSPVLTRFNINDIDHVLDKAVELNASAFSPSIFMPSGRGKKNEQDLLLSNEELKEYMLKLLQKEKELKGVIGIEVEGVYPGLVPDENKTSGCFCNDDVEVGCSAGKTQVIITGSGEVVPCSFLYDFVAGDLRKSSLKDIWDNADVFSEFRNMRKKDLKGKCSGCEYIPEKCGGGCRAAAYLFTGNIYGEDPICWK